MVQIIRSGAFLQQCWSVHPLCVTVKRMTDEHAVVLSCSSCKSAHYLTVAMVTSQASSAQQRAGGDPCQDEPSGEECLKVCVSTHQAALTLREMDVFQDLVRLRCADCRRLYELTVSAFETRYK
jgi:ribosomal protein L33